MSDVPDKLEDLIQLDCNLLDLVTRSKKAFYPYNHIFQTGINNEHLFWILNYTRSVLTFFQVFNTILYLYRGTNDISPFYYAYPQKRGLHRLTIERKGKLYPISQKTMNLILKKIIQEIERADENPTKFSFGQRTCGILNLCQEVIEPVVRGSGIEMEDSTGVKIKNVRSDRESIDSLVKKSEAITENEIDKLDPKGETSVSRLFLGVMLDSFIVYCSPLLAYPYNYFVVRGYEQDKLQGLEASATRFFTYVLEIIITMLNLLNGESRSKDIKNEYWLRVEFNKKWENSCSLDSSILKNKITIMYLCHLVYQYNNSIQLNKEKLRYFNDIYRLYKDFHSVHPRNHDPAIITHILDVAMGVYLPDERQLVNNINNIEQILLRRVDASSIGITALTDLTIEGILSPWFGQA